MTTAIHALDNRTASDEIDGTLSDTDILLRREHSFSALVPSLKPSLDYCLTDLGESDLDPNSSSSPHYYDEFGFRVDPDGGLPSLFLESSANRRAWLTCLEFSYTYTLGVTSLDDYDSQYATVGSTVDEEDDQLWSRVHSRLVSSPRLTDLVRGQAVDVLTLTEPGEQLGVPHSLRPHVWPRLIGALEKAREAKQRDPPVTYSELVQLSSSEKLMAGFQIEKDLFRTLPNNICFRSSNSTGISRLRRVLRSLAWLYVDVGYCQGMGLIVATLLLCLEEENAFWMMCTIIEDLLPPSYYSSVSLLGVQADQAVLRHLVAAYLPELDQLLKEHDIELSLVTLQWFLTLYSSVCPTAMTLRIWDLLFYEGSVVLFRIALALLTLKAPEILQLENPAQIFNALSAAPSSITDVGSLIKVAYSLDEELFDISYIAGLRRHHLAQLMVEDSALLKQNSRSYLPKQYLAKRQLRRPRSMLSTILHSMTGPGHSTARHLAPVPFRAAITSAAESLDDPVEEVEDPKLKNIRQTEMLVELKQAIRMIIRHFRHSDPQYANATSQADYSMEGHSLDWENYVQVAQHPQHRTKALCDFERQEPDELSFSKNDIITVINADDEHCWYGELGDAHGWFPAKFVELLDERGKIYSAAGDDSVDKNIVSLVRGNLCSALGAVFTHGIKQSRLLGYSLSHPWHFIEEAAIKEVERDFSSVYSRLVLCKTFRLDAEGKVLSPEEVLYRAVQSINISHDLARVHADVKFRSLICYGLNEQLLHLWLETLCSSTKRIERWYHPWSYLRSPGWVQIKCELRLLNQFSFRLSPTYELDQTRLTDNNRSIGSLADGRNRTKRWINPLMLKRLASPSSTNRSSKVYLPPRSASLSSWFPTSVILDDFCTYPMATGADAGDMLVKYHLFSWEL